jgi:hypothetical protein
LPSGIAKKERKKKKEKTSQGSHHVITLHLRVGLFSSFALLRRSITISTDPSFDCTFESPRLDLKITASNPISGY